ncbi:hypothetical protein SJC03_35 [Bacteroides phage SJC03]|nr:hypothetical protein SJC03_35 [Bacteroides phage SJC03]
MVKFLAIILGLIFSYFTCVGINDNWNFLIDINPTECIKRIITFIVFSIIYSLFLGFILLLIKEY